MVNAIKLLRATADECEQRAKQVAARDQGRIFDIAAEWHWLAGQAARLHDRANELGNAAEASS